MAAAREVNIAAAIAYTQDRARESNSEDRGWDLPAKAIADCINSGLAGQKLTDTLRHHFPAAKRDDVYLAIGLASALFHADLMIAQMELAALKRPEGAG